MMLNSGSCGRKITALPKLLQSREGWGRFFEMKRSDEPHLHQIEPTNACPYECVMCPRSKRMDRQVGFMNLDLFKKIMDEIASYSQPNREKEIELFHFGESLLHRDIVEMTSYLASHGLNNVLSVNAPELTPALTEQLLSAGAGKIIISLDGYDEKSYRSIRGKHADYDMAVKNIDAAINLHSEMKSSTKLVVRMIKLHENAENAELFKTRWESTGIEVELRDFFPWGEKEMTELGTFDRYPPHMPCPFPWQYLVVQNNGDVVPCCRDYNGVNVMGNANTESLKEIWNGSRFTDFRNRMASGDYDNTLCGPCLAPYFTTT